MDIIDIITQYKALLGGAVIGTATITGVALNIAYNRTIEGRIKKEKNASTTSAIAAELLCNSKHLRNLYLAIHSPKKHKYSVTEYKHIDTQVYQELLQNIGELGSSITFMVVDSYGDLKKMRGRMEIFDNQNEITKNKDKILKDIQIALVKTMSCALTLYLYADYMTGKQWSKLIKEQRIIRIERTLTGFCKFIEKIDAEMQFIDMGEEENLEFRKRFGDKQNRADIKQLFLTIHDALEDLPKQPQWRAQLTLRALSYKIQNTLTSFLDIEADEYDILSEQEYGQFL
jgi:hypothetical protein